MLGPACEGAAALDAELRRLYEEVASAGSWAMWMGVFSRSWLRLLRLGGMGHKRAMRLTRHLCRIIDEFRADVARVRHERARRDRDEQRVADAQRLLAEVRRLYPGDRQPPCALDVLELKGHRAHQRYVRRRGGEEFVRAHEHRDGGSGGGSPTATTASDEGSDGSGDGSSDDDGDGNTNPKNNEDEHEASTAARSKTSGLAATASPTAAGAGTSAGLPGRGAGASTRRGGGGGKEGWVL